MLEQRPGDPAALGEQMAEMIAAAEAALERCAATPPPELGYELGALAIYHAMRPRFGPANGWLYQERDALLRQLADRCQLPAAARERTLDDAALEAAAGELERIEEVADDLGLESAVRPSSRGELAWTPAAGYALQLRDTGRKVRWRPPYAGTVAGPDVPATAVNPRLTLFLYPPSPGEAEQLLLRREQPGEVVFYSGELLAYLLQEPQSHDVEPSELLSPLVAALERARLVAAVGEETIARARQQLGAGSTVDARWGVLRAAGHGPPPPAARSLPGVLLWTDSSDDVWRHTLLINR